MNIMFEDWVSSEFIETLLKHLTAGVAILDREGRVVYANRAIRDMTGLTDRDIEKRNNEGERWPVLDHNGQRLDVEDYPIMTVFQTGTALENTTYGVISPHSSSVIWLKMNVAPIFAQDGTISYVIATCSDISEERRLIHKSRRIAERLDLFFKETSAAICMTDADLRIRRVNPAFESLVDINANDTHHPSLKDYLKQLDTADLLCPGELESDIECQLSTHSHQLKTINIHVTEMALENDETEYVFFLSDISERVAYQALLESRAQRDPLTQLYNRRYLYDRLKTEIERSNRHERNLSLIMLDLDHFKGINDQYGHLAGDQVLVQVAKILEDLVRSEDICARWGGEEFIVLMPETDLSGAYYLAERLREALCTSPIALNGSDTTVQVTTSVGIATLQPGVDMNEFLDTADQYLYEAKNAGRNTICCDLAKHSRPVPD